ncbi:DUF7317 family protein [Halomarina litorea]|uniref:DUF7317 family protein n=1 Tax=Halomarina litorea TaxID=2961595 RepID=UPI0020C3C1FE|nr:hypothetical protein [Halomarina sp. BCD28]
MTRHAVDTARALYLAGTLTLEQAAGYAGCTPERLAERLHLPDPSIDLPDATVSAR